MLEVLEKKDSAAEDLEDDGWQTLDWHDWRLATKDKNMAQYLTRQTKEAVAWYQRATGREIPGYEKNKSFEGYDAEMQMKIGEAITEYLKHVDEKTGLTGSENFARRNLMYRGDLTPDKIALKYEKWEELEKAREAAVETTVR
jgi:hypothetical protein